MMNSRSSDFGFGLNELFYFHLVKTLMYLYFSFHVTFAAVRWNFWNDV